MKINSLLFAIMCLGMASCGSGDTGEGYNGDTTSLNENAGMIDSNIATAAGERGNPDSTVGATTNAKAPDSNATNPAVR